MAVPFHLRSLDFSLSNPNDLSAEEICLATFHPGATDSFLASLYKHWNRRRESLRSAGMAIEKGGIAGLSIDFRLDDLNSLSSEELAIVASGFHLDADEDDKETLKAQRLFSKRRERDLAKSIRSRTPIPIVATVSNGVAENKLKIGSIEEITHSAFIKQSSETPVPAPITTPAVSVVISPSSATVPAPVIVPTIIPIENPIQLESAPRPVPDVITSKLPPISKWDVRAAVPPIIAIPLQSSIKPIPPIAPDLSDDDLLPTNLFHLVHTLRLTNLPASIVKKPSCLHALLNKSTLSPCVSAKLAFQPNSNGPSRAAYIAYKDFKSLSEAAHSMVSWKIETSIVTVDIVGIAESGITQDLNVEAAWKCGQFSKDFLDILKSAPRRMTTITLDSPAKVDSQPDPKPIEKPTFTAQLVFGNSSEETKDFQSRFEIISLILLNKPLTALRVDKDQDGPFQITIGFESKPPRTRAVTLLKNHGWETTPEIKIIEPGIFDWKEEDRDLALKKKRLDQERSGQLKKIQPVAKIIEAVVKKETSPVNHRKSSEGVVASTNSFPFVPPSSNSPAISVPPTTHSTVLSLNSTALPVNNFNSTSDLKTKPISFEAQNPPVGYNSWANQYPTPARVNHFDSTRDNLSRILPYGWTRSPQLYYFHNDRRPSTWFSPVDLAQNVEMLAGNKIPTGPRADQRSNTGINSLPVKPLPQVGESIANNKRGLQDSGGFSENWKKAKGG